MDIDSDTEVKETKSDTVSVLFTALINSIRGWG